MKKCTLNLLSINRNAFRFLHDAEGFDFEKTYFMKEQAGKFTANTVSKAVQEKLNPTQCKIAIFIVPTNGSNKNGLYFATLKYGKFDGMRKDGVKYWDYNNYNTEDQSSNIEYCWGVGDFEELRKNDTEKIFIIAQDKTHIVKPIKKNLDLSGRFVLLKTHERWESNMQSKHIHNLELEITDGSRKHFEYEPYNMFWGKEKQSANIADFIDKSGYLLHPRRFELMRKAELLRRERKQIEINNINFTEATAELQELINNARCVLSASVMTCNNSDTARELLKKMGSFSCALSYFADYNRKLVSKEYTSIDRVKADINIIKEKLSYCIMPLKLK